MAFTPNLGLTYLNVGQQQAHVLFNEALLNLDKIIAGKFDITFPSGDTVNLTGGQSSNMILRVAAATGNRGVVVQNTPKVWIFINDSTFDVTVQIAGAISPAVVPPSSVRLLVCDGIAGSGVRLVGFA